MALTLFLAITVGIFGFFRIVVRGYFVADEGDGNGPRRGDLVGLVRIQGGIFDSRGTVKALERLRQNPQVKALLLRIETPGGGVGPTQEIYEAVHRFRRSGRKVVASLGSVAASGGYYIASASDKIFANPGTITGSIGVVMVLPNAEKALGNLGLRFNVIKSAPHKDLASPLRALSEKEQQILQRLVDDTYGQFVRAVAAGRKLSEAEAFRIADGSVFSGERAKGLGLVDALGTERDATIEAARLGGIEGEPKVIEMRPEGGFFALLTGFAGSMAEWFGAGGIQVWSEYPGMLQYMWR